MRELPDHGQLIPEVAIEGLEGQQLTSVGEIELFEYQDPEYVLTRSLKT